MQANLETWSPIVDHIDRIMASTIKAHPYVTVSCDVHGTADLVDDADLDREQHVVPEKRALVQHSLVLFQCLRFTLLLLENATRKTVYSSMEVRAAPVW